MSDDQAAASGKKKALTFELEKGRYRLYAAMNCPFAHRVRVVRLLHGLEDSLELTWVTGQTSESFTFDQPEPEFGATTLKGVYAKAADPSYSGKATVPMILDKRDQTMADNESLDSAFALAARCRDDQLAPEGCEELAREISATVSIAVYKFLFATDPAAKEETAQALWAKLDEYERRLESQPYLLGDRVSIADFCLWASLIRYDNVYARQFGIKGRTLKTDYPNLAKFVERLWKTPSKRGDTTLGEDATMAEIVRMYWTSGNLAPKAGNDPRSAPPEVLPVF